MIDLVDLYRRMEEARRICNMRFFVGGSPEGRVAQDLAHAKATEQLRRLEAAYRRAVEQAALAELDGPA